MPLWFRELVWNQLGIRGFWEEATTYPRVFESRGRSLVAASIGLVALLLALAPPAPASDSSITLGLRVARTNPVRPTLDLRGTTVGRDNPGAFRVETHIARIPCPGEYRFDAAEEDSSNGNSSTYSALLRLFDPSIRPAGSRCGGPPPLLPGRVNVLLQDRVDRLFVVRGARSNGGAFEGGLSFSRLPQCDRSYELEADLDLAGWSRSAEFKVQVLEIHTTLQGRPVQSERC